MDISAEDLETDGEIASNDSEVEGTPGEAVLTSGEAENTVAQAKVAREQMRLVLSPCNKNPADYCIRGIFAVS